MNELQQKALKKHHLQLLNSLDLDAVMVGKFIHHGLFNENMIEKFQSAPTRREQISQMLLKLPYRGPRAFEFLLLSIQADYGWLADGLRETYNKLTNNKESDNVTLKEKVEMFVHEEFGNSKRLCEEDKKTIRKFLYKHLKEIANADSELAQEEREAAIEKEVKEHLCQEILAMFPVNHNDADSVRMSDDSMDEPMEYSIDSIQRRMNEFNEKLENYKAELEKCYNVLGLTDCVYPLPDVLETYKEKMINENQELEEKLECMKDKIAMLEKRCNRLRERLYHKDQDFIKLTNRNYDNDEKDAEVKELREKCNELESKLENTRKGLSSMVTDLSPPSHRPVQVHPKYSYDQTDGPSDFHLPAIDQSLSRAHTHRQMHPTIHIRRARERTSLNLDHSFLGRRNNSGQPWK